MRKITLTLLLAVICTAGIAQSSEAGYPVGNWQSDPDANIFVDMTINRESYPDPNFGNKLSCGTLTFDGKPDYEAMIKYIGRGVDNNGMPGKTFFFNVISKDNKTSKISILKMPKEENEYGNATKIKFVKVTGDLANNPALKQQLYSVGAGNGAAFDPTPWVVTDKELIDALKDGVANGLNITGFGNVRQYISAHDKLEPGKFKYAKCKGTGNINIRKEGDAKADKIAELKPGTTLLVNDEYNGWCKVKLKDNHYGWVSLSVVTLTNTPSAVTMVQTLADLVDPVLVNGKLAFMGIPIAQSKDAFEMQLKEKGFVEKKEEWGSGTYWSGNAYGEKVRVYMDTSKNIGISEVKEYNLSNAKKRITLLKNAFLEATHGKIIEDSTKYDSDEGGRLTIGLSCGKIDISYENSDVVNFSSDIYDVRIMMTQY